MAFRVAEAVPSVGGEVVDAGSQPDHTDDARAVERRDRCRRRGRHIDVRRRLAGGRREPRRGGHGHRRLGGGVEGDMGGVRWPARARRRARHGKHRRGRRRPGREGGERRVLAARSAVPQRRRGRPPEPARRRPSPSLGVPTANRARLCPPPTARKMSTASRRRRRRTVRTAPQAAAGAVRRRQSAAAVPRPPRSRPCCSRRRQWRGARRGMARRPWGPTPPLDRGLPPPPPS